MTRRIALAVFIVLAVGSIGSTRAQDIPAVGLSVLLCRVGVSGSGDFCASENARLCVSVADNGATAGTGTATVTVTHGPNSSTHVVTYQDDGDGVLDCGDVIVSVS